MSSTRVTIGPSVEPISLEELKAHSRIDFADDDALVASYLMTARQFIEDSTRRTLMNKTFVQTFDFDWPYDAYRERYRLELKNPPIVSISSISYIDTSGVSQTLSPSLYKLTKGDIFGAIEIAYGAEWPSVRAEVDAITVTYVAGYGTNPGDIPKPLKSAVMMMAAHLYENRETVSPSNLIEMPFSVKALISDYLTYE